MTNERNGGRLILVGDDWLLGPMPGFDATKFAEWIKRNDGKRVRITLESWEEDETFGEKS